MAIHREIKHASIDELFVDPKNPRLGRREVGDDVPQERVLELMRDWALDELATSFLESGFWPQEALVVVKEQLYGQGRLVVVEGNRRLAALKYLKDAIEGEPITRKWRGFADAEVPDGLFDQVPYVLADTREDVEIFLGFRHVTGIKEWEPAEKAEYIAKLINERNMTYREVMRRIGSKTDAVRRNYIAYQTLLQLEELEGVALEQVEEKFSVLFLSLREGGVQRFLDIDIRAEPDAAEVPVPGERLENLGWFATWLFGTEDKPPLFTDSRNVGRFAHVLDSPAAVDYLKEAEDPSFDLAVRKAGADEPELIGRVQRATDEVEQVLSRVHLHFESEKLTKAVERFGKGAYELLRKFPPILDAIFKPPKED